MELEEIQQIIRKKTERRSKCYFRRKLKYLFTKILLGKFSIYTCHLKLTQTFDLNYRVVPE
jgi:hypothetical protein